MLLSHFRHDGVGAVQFACVPRFGELVKFDEGNYNSSKTDEKSVYFFKCIDERVTLVFAFSYKVRHVHLRTRLAVARALPIAASSRCVAGEKA